MKAKRPLLLGLSLLLAMLLLAACGPTSAGTSPSGTTNGSSATATTVSSATVTPNPFAQAIHAMPDALPGSMATIVVELNGVSWVLPAAVSLSGHGDSSIVLAEAQRQVATVHSLVARMISGWPSTTWNPSWTEEALAKWRQDLRVAGVTALTLAGLVGEQAALEQAWVDYEQSLADAGGGWGPPEEISSRVEEWKAEARALTQAITARTSTTTL